MANIYKQDSTPSQTNFLSDFETHHPGFHTFKVNSTKLNLKAPVISPFIKHIEEAKSIDQARIRLTELCTVVHGLGTHKSIMAEIIPEQNNVCTINLYPTKKQSKLFQNLKFGLEKANTFHYGLRFNNLFNNFQHFDLVHRKGTDNKSNALQFKLNYPLANNNEFNFKLDWKTKNIEEMIKSHSLTTKLNYRISRSLSTTNLSLRIKNRANEVEKYTNPKLIETSHLYEIGLKQEYQPSRYTRFTLEPRLGFVPVKKSYFGKLIGKFSHVETFSDFAIKASMEGGLVVGKNVGINDKLEYRPQNRAQTYYTNKLQLFLMNYPHQPLHPIVVNIPYTYLQHWLSYDKKRSIAKKQELEMGIGMIFFGVGQHSSLRLGFQFRCLKFQENKPVWAPKISFHMGEV